MRTSKRRQGQDSTLQVERLFIPSLCPLQANAHFPNTFPARGKGYGREMRPGSTDCVCVLSEAPPPTSVGFLTANGLRALLSLRARQTDRSRGRRQRNSAGEYPASCDSGPTTRTHEQPHGNRPFGKAE